MPTTAALNSAFGALLREARQATGISQDELAARADIHRTYVSLLERGIKTPTLETFMRLCAAVDRQPDDFIAALQRRIGREA